MFRRRVWSYRIVSNILSYARDIDMDKQIYYGKDKQGRVVYYAKQQQPKGTRPIWGQNKITL